MNSNVYYTYFKPIIKEEHMLFSKEIAEMYNIRSKTGKYASTFVSAYLQHFAKIKNVEQLYYSTSKGMTKVYPRELYMPIMNELKENIKDHKACSLKINDKTYTILGGKQ